MDAIELLLNRVSMPKLDEPGPTDEQLEIMYRAALRAPDHGALRPWRFMNVRGDARQQLNDIFLAAALADNPELEQSKRDKFANLCNRAPLVVIAIARIEEHPKVPAIEQQLAAGAAVQNMLLAAYAQNIGAIWRTGEMAFNRRVNTALGLAENEQIIGFLYFGKQPEKLKRVPALHPADFVEEWNG